MRLEVFPGSQSVDSRLSLRLAAAPPRGAFESASASSPSAAAALKVGQRVSASAKGRRGGTICCLRSGHAPAAKTACLWGRMDAGAAFKRRRSCSRCKWMKRERNVLVSERVE